jgi:uncharacterized Zn-binding protein involved in type VI secretion|tara:strand:+ start:1746 stop:2051 length:306 start_codon:yes stop_codon:yes gene_type:complete
MRAASTIGHVYLNRCNTPVQATGSPNVFVNKLAKSKLGDVTAPYLEIVPCPKCCKTHVAPVITGAPKNFTNKIASERLGDLALGITGTFPIIVGSPNVFMS